MMPKRPRVRAAQTKDANSISDVLIRSITELCADDHNNRPEHIASWTANKTPKDVLSWIESGCFVRVTETHSGIGSVGAYLSDGSILLLYVAPDHRGQGHSSVLLAAMELELSSLGLSQAKLISSRTAQNFYLKNGWQLDGGQVDCYTTEGQPMRKSLKKL